MNDTHVAGLERGLHRRAVSHHLRQSAVLGAGRTLLANVFSDRRRHRLLGRGPFCRHLLDRGKSWQERHIFFLFLLAFLLANFAKV